MQNQTQQQPVLELRNVSVGYDSAHGTVQAVRNVSLKIYPNTIVGLIGESGSGKSTLANAIMNLLKNNARLLEGEVIVQGQNVYEMSKKELRKFRWNRMSMVFQSAMNALNPVLTVEQQIADVFSNHRPNLSKKEIHEKAVELMHLVSIDPKHLRSYPHELSGGMRQRVVIAIAVALEPDLVIMDEPTTALDVVVQKSILDKIKELQRQKGFAVLFISHDFSLVAELAEKVAIMYAGRFVEITDSRKLNLNERHHPYTEGLLRAIPELTAETVTIEGIPGNPPDLINLPTGCAYHPRCKYAMESCKTLPPVERDVEGRLIACHLYEEEAVK
ncbi:ABC transporter ATP-binding protein [Pullulanibacillus sp. KACC 23026]|uniref:ABC transporter ATP-binding protein n=1 Tax=Pullulanibacillus sp. KACC 23026 TaxID=3028315 RepID=UPI0023B02B0C|nr:ABC transporter ATP-binding protein [Pullulanibacillus sp. KACC 23026]WEG11992.1 ABC transporter ATP-binding protein [Pullulanibacillus sp. KACC 23026]